MRGRVVRVLGIRDGRLHLLGSFDVGCEQDALAIQAVRLKHPELHHCQMHADEQLSATAVAFLDLGPGEVKERLSPELSRDARIERDVQHI